MKFYSESKSILYYIYSYQIHIPEKNNNYRSFNKHSRAISNKTNTQPNALNLTLTNYCTYYIIHVFYICCVYQHLRKTGRTGRNNYRFLFPSFPRSIRLDLTYDLPPHATQQASSRISSSWSLQKQYLRIHILFQMVISVMHIFGVQRYVVVCKLLFGQP